MDARMQVSSQEPPGRAEPSRGRKDGLAVRGLRRRGLSLRGVVLVALAISISAAGASLPGTALAADACQDINSANAAELQRIRGVGPSKARAILEDRTKNGPFEAIEQVTRVSGIGPATLGSIRQAGFCVSSETARHPGAPQPRISSVSVAARPAQAAAGAGGCTDINTADSAALESITGIGPSKARAILEYRARSGPFQTIEAVAQVSGVGPATLANIRAAGYCGGDGSDASGETPPARPAPSKPPAAQELQVGECTDINSATAAMLESITGIGPSKARAVLDFIQRNGPFTAIDQVGRVSGIGPATLRNIRQAGYCAQ